MNWKMSPILNLWISNTGKRWMRSSRTDTYFIPLNPGRGKRTDNGTGAHHVNDEQYDSCTCRILKRSREGPSEPNRLSSASRNSLASTATSTQTMANLSRVVDKYGHADTLYCLRYNLENLAISESTSPTHANESFRTSTPPTGRFMVIELSTYCQLLSRTNIAREKTSVCLASSRRPGAAF